MNYPNAKVFEVTAYTNGYESTGKYPGHPEYGITASGKRTKEGRTVAAPPSIPFGTKLYIEGIGYRIVEDRGADIVEGRLDLFIEDLNRAKKFGRQKLKVIILN